MLDLKNENNNVLNPEKEVFLSHFYYLESDRIQKRLNKQFQSRDGNHNGRTGQRAAARDLIIKDSQYDLIRMALVYSVCALACQNTAGLEGKIDYQKSYERFKSKTHAFDVLYRIDSFSNMDTAAGSKPKLDTLALSINLKSGKRIQFKANEEYSFFLKSKKIKYYFHHRNGLYKAAKRAGKIEEYVNQVKQAAASPNPVDELNKLFPWFKENDLEENVKVFLKKYCENKKFCESVIPGERIPASHAEELKKFGIDLKNLDTHDCQYRLPYPEKQRNAFKDYADKMESFCSCEDPDKINRKAEKLFGRFVNLLNQMISYEPLSSSDSDTYKNAMEEYRAYLMKVREAYLIDNFADCRQDLANEYKTVLSLICESNLCHKSCLTEWSTLHVHYLALDKLEYVKHERPKRNVLIAFLLLSPFGYSLDLSELAHKVRVYRIKATVKKSSKNKKSSKSRSR